MPELKKSKAQPDQQAVQQKYMALQLLDRQMKQLQQQASAVEEQVAEIQSLQQNLDDFKDVTEGSEILVPLASGMFAKAKVLDPQNLLVNVGSNTVVQRTIPEAKALLEKQDAEMQRLHATLAEKLEEMAAQAADLAQELQRMMGAQSP